MSDINQKILAAMQQQSNAEKVSEQEANTLQLIGRSFKGTFKFTAIAIISLQVIFIGLAIYFGFNLFNEQNIGIKLHWLLGTLVAFIIFAAMRLWLFMELNRLSVLREVKRVELQLALLSNQLINNNKFDG
ncbi:hypothetical protein Q4574_02395 [Aliiglaciecola sp. 3_MG-2023]|uniref:DUF6768 family protein n=1 Tax=Aliiglaciecola TaxID=1406885 RepID=UPI001C0A32F2|nr:MULTISPECIES: DUF6768 family protein [Aliiglaciecola]MBU2878587.1 hypothetical protein [Aliiglaciecola lipolytica]MDO6692112.1 hypothetical protein [Aliiglaciecola sp. 3_MG-2023]MDO6709584.1 hypothetical protein [Aliiglaciecola sp. 2_MG-2023]MDO6750874.1 hypothetical protein [Aliiglaciecola sp. 1_MG-2023]